MLLHDDLLREIGALTRTVHAIIEIKFKSLNLQKGQSIYLTRVCENPGINLKELSQLLMADKTTTSKVVKKLIGIGLVTKHQDEDDKRAYRLFPTEKAQRAYRIIIEEENRLTEQCYAGFDEDGRSAVLAHLRTMRRNIEDDWFTLKRYR